MIVTPDGEVKVLDFGLATLFARSDTMAPSQVTTRIGDQEPEPVRLAGTLPYMSPEQARMEALDARSDIFSLGTMLYEMTTGQLELDRIIQKAMAPRRGDRFQAVEDLAVDLEHLGKELESGPNRGRGSSLHNCRGLVPSRTIGRTRSSLPRLETVSTCPSPAC